MANTIDSLGTGSDFQEISNLHHNYEEKEGLLCDSANVSFSTKEKNVAFSPTPPTEPTTDSYTRSDIVAGYTVDQAIDKLGFGPFQLILFFFCGLVWIATAMEVMILSILSPAVKCQWSLSSHEEAIITSIVFVGAIFGSLVWGIIGDNFGRLKTLMGMNLVNLVFGVLSALKLTPDDARIPGYLWMLLCRFAIGFGAYGDSQASAYYIEFLSRRTRGICTVGLTAWWAIGTIFGAALAVGVMGYGQLSWHWYLGLSAIPTLIVVCFIPFMPESARLNASRGRKKETMQVLKRIAWFNFRSLPRGELLISPDAEGEDRMEDVHVERKENCGNEVGIKSEDSAVGESFTDDNSDSDDSKERRPLLDQANVKKSANKLSLIKDVFLSEKIGVGKLCLLFSNGMWRTTLALCFLCFGTTWLYFGGVLLNTTMLLENPRCDGNESALSISNLSYMYSSGSGLDVNTSNVTLCEDTDLDTDEYFTIMWTTAAEFPGALVSIAIIEIIGRKPTIIVNLTMSMLGFCLLFICTSEGILSFFFFIIRAFSNGAFQAVNIYILEVYPTNIRGIGIGFTSSVANFGAIMTPYVAQVLFQASDYATIGLYAGSCLALILVALSLPIETKGKSLK